MEEIIKTLKKIQQEAQKKEVEKYLKEGNEIKLKDMVKKGQLEEIAVKEPELKELKKELNKYGVKFSVMKDRRREITMFSSGKGY